MFCWAFRVAPRRLEVELVEVNWLSVAASLGLEEALDRVDHNLRLPLVDVVGAVLGDYEA